MVKVNTMDLGRCSNTDGSWGLGSAAWLLSAALSSLAPHIRKMRDVLNVFNIVGGRHVFQQSVVVIMTILLALYGWECNKRR